MLNLTFELNSYPKTTQIFLLINTCKLVDFDFKTLRVQRFVSGCDQKSVSRLSVYSC